MRVLGHARLDPINATSRPRRQHIDRRRGLNETGERSEPSSFSLWEQSMWELRLQALSKAKKLLADWIVVAPTEFGLCLRQTRNDG